eukprot:CAMPEP_0203789796 /NCGR_PEP_ID=MMETSP0100_2-20121128/3673_1 /ASSEMBLY_ACC=CAM_ASM_000210 /TAXON_ID=96639 /ORGANISM=" , Strain NY0313808BC1" /LENGTH=248 /DNA_ID=CAMNT_0050692833 /DNA_START=40 /DNA_END=783 /DNA_ORIENTATION=+
MDLGCPVRVLLGCTARQGSKNSRECIQGHICVLNRMLDENERTGGFETQGRCEDERCAETVPACQQHKEPQSLISTFGLVGNRCKSNEFASAWFQEFQELAACVLGGGDWDDYIQRLEEEHKADEDDDLGNGHVGFVAEALSSGVGLNSHIVCHSTEGYYIPSKGGSSIHTPMFDCSGELPGGWVGSSDILLKELLELCGVLELELRPLKGAVRRGGGVDISPSTLKRLELCSASVPAEKRSRRDRLC